ncbi:MAG: OsmC family protein [Anaerolineae bacterium]
MRVTATSLKNLQVSINAGNHMLLADEPIQDGGDDKGPAPYDLLLSALAACKVMTVHLYARRKQWPVDTVTIALEHEKVSAAECEDCRTTGTQKVDVIRCEISFDGDLDEAQIKRLADIADRCPIHRTLTSETVIRTTVV